MDCRSLRLLAASFSANSDLQRRLHYHSAWLRTTQARSTSSRRGDFSWGAAPNPECKQVSCGLSSVRGVGRSPTLKIRILRNLLSGSTARSIRRSGNAPKRSGGEIRRSRTRRARKRLRGALFASRRSWQKPTQKCRTVNYAQKALDTRGGSEVDFDWHVAWLGAGPGVLRRIAFRQVGLQQLGHLDKTDELGAIALRVRALRAARQQLRRTARPHTSQTIPSTPRHRRSCRSDQNRLSCCPPEWQRNQLRDFSTRFFSKNHD